MFISGILSVCSCMHVNCMYIIKSQFFLIWIVSPKRHTLCKERSQPVGTDSSRHNINTPNTNQWSLFIVTLQTTLMDRQSAHLMTRVQRLLTCAVTDYYTTPSSRRSVSIGWSSCSLGIPVLYFCRLISMGSLNFCRFFMW